MTKEALKLALDALGQLWLFSDEAAVIANPAITALREALAEQPEPVQQCMEHGECFGGKCIYPAPQPAQQEPVDRLLDEAKLLADDRPVEVGNLPEWALDAEHMIRRLVKAFNSATQPAQRKPLTDEQISEIAINNPPMVHEFARAIEAAHNIKENT